MILTAATLLFLIGLVHSVLGEKYLIIRLLRRDNLPNLLGSDWFTKRLIRFAWHLTTLAWWAIALIIIIITNQTVSFESSIDEKQFTSIVSSILQVVSISFLISGTLALIASKGKHLAWIVFYVIGICCYLAPVV